jgi:UDP-N-acetylmuramyl tripeptide synthase
VIGLPRGLSFTGNFRGVKVVGSGHYKLSLSHGKLVITLKRALTQVGITVSPPSDKATASLRTKVKHHKLKSLTVTVTVTGSNGHTSTLRLSLTPS